VPLGVGDRQLLTRFLLTILGDIFPREGTAVLAAKGAEELEGSASCAPTSSAAAPKIPARRPSSR
jgi:hypothetical protein